MPNAEVAVVIYVAIDSRQPPNDSQKFNLAGDTAVTNPLPRGEFRDTNASAVYAIYSILRRQPWKTMATATWDTMRRFLHMALIAGSLAALLPTMAQARLYNVVSSEVPFDFQIGERTFKPGRYDFIIASPGVVAMRDSRMHIVANIATRPRTTGGLADKPKLVFNTHTKTAQLIQIWVNKDQPGMDVVGEEKTVHSSAAAPLMNTYQPGLEFLMERPSAPRLKY
jgi:hypothetical protein